MRKFMFFVVVFLVFTGCVKRESLTSYTVEISPNMIDNYLQKEFPVEEKLSIGKLILKDPKTKVEGDKIQLGTTVALKLPLIPELSGKVYVSGGLYFDRNSRELYLKDPSVNSLMFNNTDLLKYLPQSSKNILLQEIKEIIASIPVYKLENKSLSEKLVKDIKIQNGKLLVTFGF